jgi:hypothetical protein
MITGVALLSIFIVRYTLINLKPTNEELVLQQFIYAKLIECREKLGAYGEKNVDFNVDFHTATGGKLEICLEKLGAYGETIELPLVIK